MEILLHEIPYKQGDKMICGFVAHYKRPNLPKLGKMPKNYHSWLCRMGYSPTTALLPYFL